MAYYTEPTSNETAGLFEMFKYVNNVADGLFWPSMMLVIWVVIFIGTKQYSSARAFTAASTITGFVSIILAVGDLVAPKWMYLSLLMIAVGVLWLKLEK